ncbi:cation transporter [Burkholderia cenocepacia]|uniref:cation transporter n=1 Tax=Burkholderia cenocepacia TaxID=95486 RepID=UPI001F5B7D14|nr:heavy-metal-associated domain-containing protein [Burkholderia cenocepacia]
MTGFAIANMDCPSEEAQIRERLKKIDGIRGMTFDLARRHLEVTHEAAGQNAILRALHDIGMHAAVQAAPPGRSSTSSRKWTAPAKNASCAQRWSRWRESGPWTSI